ncbi:uncharacterized protein [Venturia canescens]|uniref:uncharacterized protein n=1 Tax=Venturia canescens TaxID=32260 RepID=UPI001C9C86D2|nr:uncharacterized protein LOC122419331 [Venturia canescens]
MENSEKRIYPGNRDSSHNASSSSIRNSVKPASMHVDMLLSKNERTHGPHGHGGINEMLRERNWTGKWRGYPVTMNHAAKYREKILYPRILRCMRESRTRGHHIAMRHMGRTSSGKTWTK